MVHIAEGSFMYASAAAVIRSLHGSYAGANTQSTKAKRAEDLDVDDFLNGGYMAVDADKDQDSDAIDSSDDEAGAAALASDDEQDAYDATSAAADDASSSDGTPRPAVLQSMPAATQLQQLGNHCKGLMAAPRQFAMTHTADPVLCIHLCLCTPLLLSLQHGT